MKFDLQAVPPHADVIIQEKKWHVQRLGMWIAVLVVTVLAGAAVYMEAVYGMQDAKIWVLGGGSAMALWAARYIVRHMFGLMQLSDAHPVSAQAYCVSTNEEVVQLYCIRVMQQGRRLIVGESDMLRSRLTTIEEQCKLAAYFEEHAPITNYGRCG